MDANQKPSRDVGASTPARGERDGRGRPTLRTHDAHRGARARVRPREGPGPRRRLGVSHHGAGERGQGCERHAGGGGLHELRDRVRARRDQG